MKFFYANLNSELKMGVRFAKECPIYTVKNVRKLKKKLCYKGKVNFEHIYDIFE